MSYNIKQSFVSAQYLNQAQYSIGYSFGANPNLTIGDFDQNGFIDIMSFPSNYAVLDGTYQFKPVVWLNNSGAFTATDSMAAGMTTQFARDVIIDDFNGDGINDYITCDQGFEPNRDAYQAAANFKYYYPNLMLGTSTGLTFVPEQEWNKSYSTARVFNHIGDSADFDGDGDIDFAVAAFTNTFKLYVNNGDGTFTDRQDLINTTAGASGLSFIKLGNTYGIVSGEYVGGVWDGKPFYTDAPHVLTQVNGVFTDSYMLSKPVWNGQTLDFGMVDTENLDLNGDGREDLLMTWEHTQDTRTFLSVYTQDAFNKLVKSADYMLTDLAQGATSSIETADLDHDGDIDFYVLQSGSNGGYKLTELDQAIWLNDGRGNFSHPTNFFNLVDYTSTRWEDKFGLYEFFDANNDGALDVIAISSIYPEKLDKTIGQEVTVFLNQSSTNAAGAYTQSGTGSNDFYLGGQGRLFNGKEGIDTVIYGHDHLSVSINSNGTYTVGEDTLINVERLEFSDYFVALDTDGAASAGGIYRLYQATFDRTPDLSGLGYWIACADKGQSAVSMAEAFIWSQEFQSLYGVTTNDNYMAGQDIVALVTGFYRNVLDRAPDVEGLNYWVGKINTQEKTVGRVLAEISDSPENYAATIGQIQHGIFYEQWNG